MRAPRIPRVLVVGFLGLALVPACGDNLHGGGGDDDDGDDGAGTTTDAGGVVGEDPADPSLYTTPPGEEISFGTRAGDLRNYFHRKGPAAVHLLLRSGEAPRIIAAFPAENQGIGVWFAAADPTTQLWSGEPDDGDLAAGGAVAPVTRADEDARPMHGVRATVRSDATELRATLTMLANVRTLRDYGYGLCLENAAEFPALRDETIEVFAEHGAVRIRRQQIGGERAMELLLVAGEGTTVAVRDEEVPAREPCRADAGSGSEKVIEIAGERGIQVDLIALSDEDPLTPIDRADLLVDEPAPSLELDALAFLSYAEKLQAGSWRFLTYFGRDTLLSERMLMPGLRSDLVRAGLTAVVERINAVEGVQDPNFDYTIEVGDVAHEEELGDFAAWKNQMLDDPPADLRQIRLDHKMIDDDFLLAPVLVDFFAKLEAEDPDGAADAIAAFLAQERADGLTYRDAIERNLALVLERARPFADDPAAPAAKKEKLVHLKNTVPVGQWRDSDQGIGFGRAPFDVNAGLVPGALEAAVALYTRLDEPDLASEAGRMLAAWQGVEELFLVTERLSTARANVANYAAAVGVADRSSQLEPDQGSRYAFYGISLDDQGAPVPILHTDHGLVMEFARPSDAYLVRAARTIGKDFPAGLMSPVGVMVASPALADPAATVVDPNDLRDDSDDEVVPLRDIFSSAQYHGTVVWSWQQAMLASGLRRQLQRDDIAAPTRAALQQAECGLWRTIGAAEEVRAGELWSWEPDADGRPVYRPFGFNLADVDESNAIQLWSTVYLVVHPPTAIENPSCVIFGR